MTNILFTYNVLDFLNSSSQVPVCAGLRHSTYVLWEDACLATLCHSPGGLHEHHPAYRGPTFGGWPILSLFV